MPGPTPNRDERAAPQTQVEITPDPFAFEALALEPEERAVETAQRRGIFRRSVFSWGGLFWSALGGLASLAFGLWLTALVDDAFARSTTLGVLGLVLAAVALLALLVLAAREMTAIGRQRHIAAACTRDFAHAHAGDDRTKARKLVADLASIYEKRAETARGRAPDVLALRSEIVDGRDLVEIAERTLVVPLDERAKAAQIAGAAKRVSVVTDGPRRAPSSMSSSCWPKPSA